MNHLNAQINESLVKTAAYLIP